MKRGQWKRRALLAVGLFLAVVAFQLGYGGRPDDVPPRSSFEVLAHRGVHARFQKGAYERRNGCEAQHMLEPAPPFIENTLESIGAAFERGATMVEIDVRRTRDDQLVVFHDWMLECRTDGKGQVREQPLAYLKRLDIGYGYTPDGGKSYPFRGQGVGRMPTLLEVLQAFPDKRFLLHDKDWSRETTRLLSELLKSLPPEQQRRLHYWGEPEFYAIVQQEVPAVSRLLASRQTHKQCLLPYVLSLGMVGLPDECRGMGFGLPARYARLMWGWPYRFLGKLSAADARFYVLVDTEEDLRVVAGLPLDGVVTDHIERLGGQLARAAPAPH